MSFFLFRIGRQLLLSKRPRIMVSTAITATLLTAACAGGGGGYSPTGSSTAQNTSSNTGSSGGNTSSPQPPQIGNFENSAITYSTGIIGAVAAPAAASFGASPLPAQIAMPSGPTFSGVSDVSFPALSSSLQSTSNGISAASSNQSATITVINTSASSTSVQIFVPSVGLNETLNFRENLVTNLDAPTTGLSYVALGEWGSCPSCGNFKNFTSFVFGFETPANAVPTTGAASFLGSSSAMVFKTIGPDIQARYVQGDASLSVDFASGKITGAFTKMQYWDGMPYGDNPAFLPWNDVSVNGSIASGTNKFTGTTAATSAPNSVFSLSGSSTGRIDGAFYGPKAQNIGAIWSLSDGTASALGGVTAGPDPWAY